MDRKKKADGLLAGTVLICLLAALFKETGLLGGGLFHMAFAASVGGIADLLPYLPFSENRWGFPAALTSLPDGGTKSWTWRGTW